jgi:protein TonB
MKLSNLKFLLIISFAIHLAVLSFTTVLLSSGGDASESLEGVLTDITTEEVTDITQVAPEEFGPGQGPGPAPLGDGLMRDGFGEERPGPLPLGDSLEGGPAPAPPAKEVRTAAKETSPPLPKVDLSTPPASPQEEIPSQDHQAAEPGPVDQPQSSEPSRMEDSSPTKAAEEIPSGTNVFQGEETVPSTLPRSNSSTSIASAGSSGSNSGEAGVSGGSALGNGEGVPGGTGSGGKGEGTLGSKEGVPGGTGSGPGKGRAGSRFGVPGGTGGGQGNEMNQFSAMVRRKIEKAKFYPPSARRAGIEGVVGVRFIILPDGTVEEVTIITPSPHDVLNQSAQDVISKAAPFRPRPREWQGQKLAMELNITFKLER